MLVNHDSQGFIGRNEGLISAPLLYLWPMGSFPLLILPLFEIVVLDRYATGKEQLVSCLNFNLFCSEGVQDKEKVSEWVFSDLSDLCSFFLPLFLDFLFTISLNDIYIYIFFKNLLVSILNTMFKNTFQLSFSSISMGNFFVVGKYFQCIIVNHLDKHLF